MPHTKNRTVSAINALFIALFLFGLVQIAWGVFMIPPTDTLSKTDLYQRMKNKEEVELVFSYMDLASKRSRTTIKLAGAIIVVVSAAGMALSSRLKNGVT
jgi:hypothetical protein